MSKMLASLFQRQRRDNPPTPFEQECRHIFDLARRDGDNAVAITLLPQRDHDGWDYHFTLSKTTAATLQQQMERAGHTVACVLSTRMELSAQWPDHPVRHPRELAANRQAPTLGLIRFSSYAAHGS